MRCSKCGFDGAANVPGGTCIKCGTRLNYDEASQPVQRGASYSNEVNDSQSRPTMIGVNLGAADLPNADLKATRIVGAPEPSAKSLLKQTVVQGAMPDMSGAMKKTVIQGHLGVPTPAPAHDSSLNKGGADDLTCPKCGYPLADRYSSCPNCGFDFEEPREEEPKDEPKPEEPQKGKRKADKTKSKNHAGDEKSQKEDAALAGTVGLSSLKKESVVDDDIQITCEQCGETISATFSFCPKCGTKVTQRTLQGLRRHKKKTQEEIVEEIPALPEKVAFSLTIVPEEDEELTPEAQHFEGSEVVLNRSNTEPDNRTITSKEQAVVSFDNGKWYIENHSEFDSTLVFANRKLEIQAGDVILLGDRRFKFDIEDIEEVEKN